VYRAIADDDNNVYFGTDGRGVAAFDGKDFSLLARPNGPQATSDWGILEDPEGVLWFLEEFGQTIDTFDPSTGEWETETLDVCCVIPFAFDAEGNLWGGGDTGVWIIAPHGHTNITTEQGLPSNQVYHLAFAGDGTTWVATEAGMAQLNGFEVAAVFRGADMGLESDGTRTLLAASDGSVWVGREGGLSHLSSDGAWEHFGIGTLFSENLSFVSQIVEHPDGSIWVATWGDGLYQLTDGEWEHYAPFDAGVRLPSPYVHSIHLAPDGSLWIGTDAGVAHFDGAQWAAWGVEAGLNHWNVNSVRVQPDGTIWFATSGGLTRWTP
jgi:ligand-binding sensor domain-containing protein